MAQYNRILVPTDFSPHAEVAIPHANQLAISQNAKVLVAHVLPKDPYPPYDLIEDSPIDEDSLVKELEQRLAAAAARFDARVEATTVLLRGNADEALTRVAAEEDIDLIVIATRGQSSLERFFLGSVTEKVVHSSPCPVLTVPAPVEE